MVDYEIRYLADDGAIRTKTIENVESEEEAMEKVWEEELCGIWCGDSILKIIDVNSV